MNLNELKYCVELAKEKHFRKAAEKCFVSLPTLSIAIKKLETELGVVIFERQKNDILITPIGKEVIDIAKSVLSKIETIKQITKQKTSTIKELKIGVIYTIGPYLLPHFISEFHQRAGNIRLLIEENYTHILQQKLETGELDIIIVSLPFEGDNIQTLPIYEEDFQLAVPKGHRLIKSAQVDLTDIENETILLLGSGHCFRDQVLKAYPKLLDHKALHSPLQKSLEGSSLETIRYMVGSGAGITILPCSACQNQDKLLDYIPLADAGAKRTVVMAWRRSFSQLQTLEIFQKTLLSVKIPCTRLLKSGSDRDNPK